MCLRALLWRRPLLCRRVGGESRLEVVTSHPLIFGVVESVAVLASRAAPRARDALLLAFRCLRLPACFPACVLGLPSGGAPRAVRSARPEPALAPRTLRSSLRGRRDAKLAVLRWDPATQDLAPSSLHYFEGDESLKAGRTAFPVPPLALADPAGRCAALLMLRHQLGVLPSMESEAAALGVEGGEGGEGSEGGGAATVGNSYVDNLGKLGIKEVSVGGEGGGRQCLWGGCRAGRERAGEDARGMNA